jgi:hypothetical protein
MDRLYAYINAAVMLGAIRAEPRDSRAAPNLSRFFKGFTDDAVIDDEKPVSSRVRRR